MKFPTNYELIVNGDHRKQVFYAQSVNGVLALQTVHHNCIVLADTADEIIDTARQFSDDVYTAHSITWHSLCTDWRMAFYKGEIALIKGGTTWQASGILESPDNDATDLVCDPHTWVYLMCVDNKFLYNGNDVIIGANPADLIVNLDNFDMASLATPQADVVAMPLLKLSLVAPTVCYRGKTYNVKETLMKNTAFIMTLVTEEMTGPDPETAIIDMSEAEVTDYEGE